MLRNAVSVAKRRGPSIGDERPGQGANGRRRVSSTRRSASADPSATDTPRGDPGSSQGRPAYDRNIRSSFVSGSYILSTTRSFRGMIALSVMVISSGQTFVQHLVMLQ